MTTATFRTLDSLGSFCDTERTIEAICWTHRGDGWAVHDWTAGEVFACRTKRDAERLVRRRLARRGAPPEPAISAEREAELQDALTDALRTLAAEGGDVEAVYAHAWQNFAKDRYPREPDA